MESVEQLSKILVKAKEPKKVHFDPGLKEPQQQSYTPLKKAKKETNYARMRKTFLDLLAKEKYMEASSYISSHTPSEVETFYDRYCQGIFNLILIYSKNPTELSFLLENISRKRVIEALSANEFKLLTNFIEVRNLLEKDAAFTSDPTQTALFSEKIRLLLEVNDEGITNAIRTIITQAGISERISEAVMAVLPKPNNNW